MVINKRSFLSAINCLTLSWKEAHIEVDEICDDDYERQLKTYEGIEIGEKARTIFSNGQLVSEKDLAKAVAKTKELLKDRRVKVIFEAAFQVDSFTAKSDIILRNDDNTFDLIEVKSSVNDKAELVDDLAYTAMVLDLANIHVRNYSLMLLAKDYRLGMSVDQMFKQIDHTNDIKERVKDYIQNRDAVASSLLSDKEPNSIFTFHCKGCDFLNECFPDYTKTESIFHLPRLSEKQFNELTSLKVKSIKEIPATFRLTDTQQLAKDGVIANKLIRNTKLSSMLSAIEWPVYYLDFESMMTAIPLFTDTAPYTQIPTQYSIHYRENPNSTYLHFEYLSFTNSDCRKDLADNLISNIGTRGTILSYSSFEKTIISGLISLFPEKGEKLQKIVERIYDLENIIKCTYHPQYMGSYSIKRTLPALLPSLSYSDLEIDNGSMAMSVFALMVKGIIDSSKEEGIRTSLLKYCERDTLAMVKLHEELMRV